MTVLAMRSQHRPPPSNAWTRAEATQDAQAQDAQARDAMSDLEREINRAVQGFVEKLTELARDAALETLQSAFANSAAIGVSVRQIAGSDRDALADRCGFRRTSRELESLAGRLAAFVHANPGLRIDQISERLGTTSRDLALPIRKLRAKGVLRIMGPNRSATYYTVRPERADREFSSGSGAPAPSITHAGQPPIEPAGEPSMKHVNGATSANEVDADWSRCLADVFTFARKLQE